MARVRLSKSFLLQQRNQLRLYERLLPSLDLKRRQLVGELARARRALQERELALRVIEAQVGEHLPMLTRTELPVERLVRVTGVHHGVDHLVGVELPTLEQVTFERARYGLLTKPAWVDVLVERLVDGARARLEVDVARRRVELLTAAVRRMTQRVNLFERVLIPNARANIRRAQIAIGDRERAAVVRAKLVKSRAQAGA